MEWGKFLMGIGGVISFVGLMQPLALIVGIPLLIIGFILYRKDI